MLNWITDITYKVESQAAEAGFVYKLACGYYRDIIYKEAVLANITNKDRILCIGGGICPVSAVMFHQLTGARVTVVDNNEICIPKAQQAIDRLGVGTHVNVLFQDGGSADIPFEDYSVVHLALQVSPMGQVFTAVEHQVNPGTKLLVRRPKKPLDNLYSRLTDSLLECCPYTTHNSRNIGSTLLYIKQEHSIPGATA
ncbi:MAG: hypothetical protein FWD96_03505 [Defluviitaleaceae bacterium]|nr:hypothetical protein [Defluviitaleaceae bacterium]